LHVTWSFAAAVWITGEFPDFRFMRLKHVFPTSFDRNIIVLFYLSGAEMKRQGREILLCFPFPGTH